jgi:hypothetical protein
MLQVIANADAAGGCLLPQLKSYFSHKAVKDMSLKIDRS